MRGLVLLVGVLFGLVGCRSVTTVCEYDSTGKVVVRRVVTDESMVKSVLMEMKDKNVAWGTSGWNLVLEATFVSQDTYMPTVKMRAQNGSHWHLSFVQGADVGGALEAVTGVGLGVKAAGVEVKSE